jgi:VIT1/CCC1 family predicted Fe2+/Mn2+ transporter
MRHPLKTGFSFGLISGIITTVGLIVGLHSGTHSKVVVIGGILTIAIADAFSDALGIHVSEESENQHSAREIWEATFSTFVAKFVFAMTFLIPILIFTELAVAIVASVIWGLCCIGIFSYFMAKEQGVKPWKVVLEHVAIALVVIICTHFVGDIIREFFT